MIKNDLSGSDRFVLVTSHCIPQHNATLKSRSETLDEEEIEDDQEQEKKLPRHVMKSDQIYTVILPN